MSPVSAEYVEELNRMISAKSPGIESREGEPGHADKQRQIGLILASRSFRSAPLLQKFLEFITSESSQGRHEELSEYVIATQVFGRPANFDPASDTIVRTQAYRLRTKLKEYYENEGKTEQVVVEVPKGRYVPTFSFRLDPRKETQTDEKAEDLGSNDTIALPWYRRQSPALLAGAAVLATAVVFAAGAFVGSRSIALRPKATAAQTVPEPLLDSGINSWATGR